MTVPEWRLVGDWFDICSCDIAMSLRICPGPDGQCRARDCSPGMSARVIYGDVRLDGFNLVALAAFEGNIWAGEAKVTMGLFIDETADERQREALQMIFGGQAGGWPAAFAANVGEMRGIEFVPITFEVAGDLASWRARGSGAGRRACGSPERTDDAAGQAGADDQPAGLGGRSRPDRYMGPFPRGSDGRVWPRTGPAKAGRASTSRSTGQDPVRRSAEEAALARPSSRRVVLLAAADGPVGHVPLSLLISLAMLTGAAWLLTIYQAASMSMPMGIAVRGGMAADGMAGMAMGGIGSHRVVVRGRGRLRGGLDGDDGGDDAARRRADDLHVCLGSGPARTRSGRPDVDLRGRLSPGLGGGGDCCLCPRPDRQRAGDESRASSSVREWAPLALGTTVAAAGLYQFTPIKRVCLRPLPLASRLHRAALARRTDRRTGDGAQARRLLLRLLLGAVRRVGRRRGDELGLDAAADPGRVRREDVSARSARRGRDRHRLDSRGDRGRQRRDRDALACPAGIDRLRRGARGRSAGRHVDREAAERGLLVAGVHVAAGLAHGLDAGVEADEVLAVAASARLAAETALIAPRPLRSMQGACTRPAIGSQVMPRWCSSAISAAFSICAGVPPRTAARPAAAMAAAEPTSPWQPTSAPEIEAFALISAPTAAAVSRNSGILRLRGAGDVVEEVAERRRHHARGAVGRRGHHLGAGGVLLVDRDGVDRDPVVDGVRRGQVLPALGEQALVDAAGAAADLEAAGQDALAAEAAVDAVGHHRPEPGEAGVDLGRGAQRPLVGALQLGDGEAGRRGVSARSSAAERKGCGTAGPSAPRGGRSSSRAVSTKPPPME